MDYTNPKLVLQSLQNLMVSIGRGGDRKDPEYPRLREANLPQPTIDRFDQKYTS